MRPCKRGIKDLTCLTLVIPLVWGISTPDFSDHSRIRTLRSPPVLPATSDQTPTTTPMTRWTGTLTDILAAIDEQNKASADLIAYRDTIKAQYLASVREKTAQLLATKKKSFTSGPTVFSTGAATLNPHRNLHRVRQPAHNAGKRTNAPLPTSHDYESNFDSSHLNTLPYNAQVIHENLITNTPLTRSQPLTGSYHPSLGRVPPAGRHVGRVPTPAPENTSFSGAARNHAGQGAMIRYPTDDPVLDRFPRDADECDFADAVACYTALKQHGELEHSNTSGQMCPDPIIKAEAKIINGLLKAFAPYYHHLVDTCLHDSATLLDINLATNEDCVLFRTVALQGLNDLTRLIAYLNRDIMTLISESQSVRLMHASHGVGSATNLAHYLEISSNVGPQATYIDSLRKSEVINRLFEICEHSQPSWEPAWRPPGIQGQ